MTKYKNIKDYLGVVEIATPKYSDYKIQHALKTFVNRPENYKKQYLQKEYKKVFDGYSYLGQPDSTNQYDTDLLHSFVLSEFTETQMFPIEFNGFLNSEWGDLVSEIRLIELELIKSLNIPGLENFYNDNIGHMLSCNYYPKVETVQKESTTVRLSHHKDVSLFTVFIYGTKAGFAYKDRLGKMSTLASHDKVVIFPGYLLEYLTKGKYKALEHHVDFSNTNEERFSFAYFSILKPSKLLTFEDRFFTSDDFYQNYLSLF